MVRFTLRFTPFNCTFTVSVVEPKKVSRAFKAVELAAEEISTR